MEAVRVLRMSEILLLLNPPNLLSSASLISLHLAPSAALLRTVR